MFQKSISKYLPLFIGNSKMLNPNKKPNATRQLRTSVSVVMTKHFTGNVIFKISYCSKNSPN